MIKISFSYFIIIFFLMLAGCPSKDNLNTNDSPNTDEPSAAVPTPVWARTEYIFQNKIDGQISIRDSGWKVILNAKECVYIEYLPTSLDFTKFIKARAGQLCGDNYRDCSNKLEASRTAGGYSDFERDKKSQEAYMEVYNVVGSDNLFETVGSPFADPSQKNPWIARCKSPEKESDDSQAHCEPDPEDPRLERCRSALPNAPTNPVEESQ